MSGGLKCTLELCRSIDWIQWRQQVRLSPQMSLSPPIVKHTGQESGDLCEIFRFLIVSAICSQNLSI